MGTEYTMYCEAKIGNRWYNIDFTQTIPGGGTQSIPVIGGKSAIGAALGWYVRPTPISQDAIAVETVLHEGVRDPSNRWGYIPGSWFADKDLDAPEYCGYFPKQEVQDLKAGMTEMICAEDMLDTEAYLALPDEAKVAYQYFEWTEEWGSRYVMRLIKHAVECRMRAVNEWLWSLPKSVRGDTDGIWWGDVRVIVYTS